MGINPSIQKLAQLMRERQEQRETPYVLLLGSSLSLTLPVRRAFAGTEDWEAFWKAMQRASPTERKALLKKPLDALGLEPGYQAMARLAEVGYFNLILTLNVDDVLDNALKALKTLSASKYRVWVHGEVTSQEVVAALNRPAPRIKVVKLRGDINAHKLPLTPKAQFEFTTDLEHAVMRWLSRDTIVVGDLAFDDDVQRCLRSGDDALWCILPDEPASDSFVMRARQSRPSGEIIAGVDVEFNAFFTALAEYLLLDDSDYREITAEMGRETGATPEKRKDEGRQPEVLKKVYSEETWTIALWISFTLSGLALALYLLASYAPLFWISAFFAAIWFVLLVIPRFIPRSSA